jgi:hypothetical protein
MSRPISGRLLRCFLLIVIYRWLFVVDFYEDFRMADYKLSALWITAKINGAISNMTTVFAHHCKRLPRLSESRNNIVQKSRINSRAFYATSAITYIAR